MHIVQNRNLLSLDGWVFVCLSAVTSLTHPTLK